MPRYPRLFLPDMPLHIVQRGHDRQPVFFNDSDYRYYLDNLAEQQRELRIELLGYCLMTNHVHLILLPAGKPENISQLMRVVAARQTRRVNRMNGRSGTLWEGRFKASLIDADSYLLACCRYIDLNPVRAGIVERPEDYPWSGFRARAGFDANVLLSNHSVFRQFGRCRSEVAQQYRRFVLEGVSNSEIATIRRAVQRNQLTGDMRFKATIETKAGRQLSTNDPGRPWPSRINKPDTFKNK